MNIFIMIIVSNKDFFSRGSTLAFVTPLWLVTSSNGERENDDYDDDDDYNDLDHDYDHDVYDDCDDCELWQILIVRQMPNLGMHSIYRGVLTIQRFFS